MAPDQNFGNVRFRNRIFVKIPVNGDSKNSWNSRINKAENGLPQIEIDQKFSSGNFRKSSEKGEKFRKRKIEFLEKLSKNPEKDLRYRSRRADSKNIKVRVPAENFENIPLLYLKFQ